MKLSFLGAGGNVTQFADTFNRTLLGIGDRYIMSRGRPDNATSDWIQASISVNRLNFVRTAVSGGFNPAFVNLYPIPLLNSSVFGKSQFAQATFLSDTSLDGGCGPGVAGAGDPANVEADVNEPNGYIALGYIRTGTVYLARNTRVGGILDTTVGWAANDVLRLNVVMGVASNVVTLYRNGVVVSTVTDSDALRPVQTGTPFWYADGHISQLWNNYSAGIL